MNRGRSFFLLAMLAALLLAGGLSYQRAEQQKAHSAGASAPATAATPAPLAAPLPPVPAATIPPPPNLGSSEYHDLSLLALSQSVPVFTYHDIIRSRQQKGAVWFDCTQAEFEDQMRFLSSHGAAVVTLAQLQAHLTLGTPLPPHAVVLTFDDSYQGFFDLAYPVLRHYGYPAAVFVHTNYVGVQTGDHPKMTWDELQQLDEEGLVTIGAHTRSHPADLALLSVAQQDDELRGSKAVLEAHLGHVVNFQSYANGKGDATTFERARLAGYTLGFLEFWTPAEQSPGIMQLGRYIHIQMPRGWDEAYGPDALPTAVQLPITAAAPLSRDVTYAQGVRLVLERGGQLETRQVAGRSELAALLQSRPVEGAAPLLLDLGVQSASGTSLPPLLTPQTLFTPPTSALPTDAATLDALQGRPLLLWNSKMLAILPYAAPLMNDEATLRAYLPGLQGAVLGGVWLVHSGAALSVTALADHAFSGFQLARRRAFVGVTDTGELLFGAAVTPVSVPRLAAAVATLHLKEAVMLDSGASADLAWANLGRIPRFPFVPAGVSPSSVLMLRAGGPTP